MLCYATANEMQDIVGWDGMGWDEMGWDGIGWDWIGLDWIGYLLNFPRGLSKRLTDV